MYEKVCFFTGTPCEGASSLDFVGVSNHLLRASNRAFFAVCGSQSDSSKLLLVTPLEFSDLALARLGGSGPLDLHVKLEFFCC